MRQNTRKIKNFRTCKKKLKNLKKSFDRKIFWWYYGEAVYIWDEVGGYLREKISTDKCAM
ncbi:MAG TPA: hypothetical protein DEQ88_01040 [Clostridiales bacterium]|nr:hypothetical protein [Clostridiales bacterium]